MKEYDVTGRTKRMGQEEGCGGWDLCKDGICGAIRREILVGALF